MRKPTMNLKPCAHCGSESVVLLRTIHDSTAYWHVECLECGMRTTEYEENCCAHASDYGCTCMSMDDAIVSAVETWNARADDANVHVGSECTDNEADELLSRFAELLNESLDSVCERINKHIKKVNK